MSGARNGSASAEERETLRRSIIGSLSEFLARRQPADPVGEPTECRCSTPEEREAARDRILAKLEDEYDAARIRRMRAVEAADRFDAESRDVLMDLEGANRAAVAACWHHAQRTHGQSARELNDAALERQHLNEASRRSRRNLDFCTELRRAGRAEKQRAVAETREAVFRLVRCIARITSASCTARLLEFERQYLPWNNGYAVGSAGHDTHHDGTPAAKGGAR